MPTKEQHRKDHDGHEVHYVPVRTERGAFQGAIGNIDDLKAQEQGEEARSIRLEVDTEIDDVRSPHGEEQPGEEVEHDGVGDEVDEIRQGPRSDARQAEVESPHE